MFKTTSRTLPGNKENELQASKSTCFSQNHCHFHLPRLFQISSIILHRWGLDNSNKPTISQMYSNVLSMSRTNCLVIIPAPITSNNQQCHPDSPHPHKPNNKWDTPMSHEQALRTASNPRSNEMEDFTT